MLFQPNAMTTERETSFLGRPDTPEDLNTSSLYEAADIAVYQAMCDSMCATYQGICANAPEIVLEGLGDMMKSAYEFFKGIIKKVVAFIKNTFNYLMSYVLDFDKFIDKYKANMSNFKPFEVSGFTYTIEGSEVDKVGIEKIINEYNSRVNNIKKMEMGDIQKIILECKSKDELGKIRARIAGLKENDKHVRSNNFTEAMMKGFRDGKTSKHTIKVDSGNINEIVSEYKEFKELIKDVKEEGNKIQAIFEDLRDFFKEMPHYEYSDSDHKKVKTYTLSDGGDHIDKKEGSDEDYNSDYYKKLTTYYNFLFRYSKDLMAIYTKAYQTKVSALKEAISFHTGVIRKALSPFADKESSEEAMNTVDSEYTMVIKEAPEEGFLSKDREKEVASGSINNKFGTDAFKAYSKVFNQIDAIKEKTGVKVLAESAVYKNAKTSTKAKGAVMASAIGLLGGPTGVVITFGFFRKLFAAQISKETARQKFLSGKKTKFQCNVYYGENIKKFISEVNSKLGNVKVNINRNTYVFAVNAKKVSEQGYDFAQVWVELKDRPVQEEFEIYPVDSSKPIVDSAVTEVTDYGELLEMDMLTERYENYYRDFNQYINEIEVLGEAYHRGMIMMEEVEINHEGGASKDSDSIFTKIIDFIKSILTKFADKAKNLFTNNEKWLAENRHKFAEIPDSAYTNITVTMIQYENVSKDGSNYKLVDPEMEAKAFMDDPDVAEGKVKDIATVSKKIYRKLCNKVVNGDLSDGAKAYYRFGDNKSELHVYKGADVPDLMKTMFDYCDKYSETANRLSTDIKDEMQKFADAAEKMLEDVKNAKVKEEPKTTPEASKASWIPYDRNSESFSIAENMDIRDTIFGIYPWVDSNGDSHFIAMEAEENKENKDGDTEVHAIGVKVEKDKEYDKEEKGKMVSKQTAMKMYYQCKVKVATALVTVAEERYVKYIKTLRDILNAAKVTKDKETKD